MIEADDLVMLVGGDGKRFIFRAQTGQELQTHKGVIRHDELIGKPWGSRAESHLGACFLAVQPSLRDLLQTIKRRSQIIFPKDIGYILLRLSVGPGMTIVEAGTGSGALTTALAWAVGPTGRVISYDRREDMQELALRNLTRAGLEGRVTLRLRDIQEGFDETDASALFLDLPQPHLYLQQCRQALRNGGAIGAVLPTANQVSELLAGLEQNLFAMPDVCEILLRFYKPVSERLRPMDRMVAHTGYLVFARKVVEDLQPVDVKPESAIEDPQVEG